MASIIAAPEQVGLLAEAPMAIANAQGRLIEARTQAPNAAPGKVSIYGGWEFGKSDIDSSAATIGSSGDVSSLNVGGDYQISSNLRAGALFGYSENKADFGGSTGGFKLNETMLTTYAALNQGNWYLGGSLGVADLKFKNVHRNIELGPTIRTEKGSTKGNHVIARLVGGLNLKTAVGKTPSQRKASTGAALRPISTTAEQFLFGDMVAQQKVFGINQLTESGCLNCGF